MTHDRLLSEVRKRLRQKHGFSRTAKKLRIDCVHSAEAPVFPDRDGQVCATRASDNEMPLRLNCESGFGSATQVTGTFGFAAAARVLARLATPMPNPELPPSAPQNPISGGPEFSHGRRVEGLQGCDTGEL